ncbi:hypothetical protein NDU88_004778 [Pleurodeles waltl]|uniref:Uncharacterized protein n=1 Tax=Pleurodeles waltl TaxID=8319 RepID=A0AAV7PH02_PLEWA|nr:hypothetical protein NDU88_004778 [Pleurodeles waltl]
MCRLTRGAEKGAVGSSVTVLWKKRTEDGAYAAGARGGGFTGRTAEETIGSARGRRKCGERSLCRNKEGCATGEVNIKGKSGGCGGVAGEHSKVFLIDRSQRKKDLGVKLDKKGKAEPPVIVRPRITPSLRSYFKILLLVALDNPSRLMEEGREEGTEPLPNTAMKKVGAEARGVGTVVVDKGEITKDQCPALGVNLESQDEQSGETPLVTVQKNNNAPGQRQSLMMEEAANRELYTALGYLGRYEPKDIRFFCLPNAIEKGSLSNGEGDLVLGLSLVLQL